MYNNREDLGVGPDFVNIEMTSHHDDVTESRDDVHTRESSTDPVEHKPPVFGDPKNITLPRSALFVF